MTARSLPRITKQHLKIASSLLLVVALMMPPLVNVIIAKASAGTFTNARVAINNSQAAATPVTYSFRFSAPATTNIGRWVIQFCNAASGTCTTPTGMTTTSATRVSDNFAGTGRSDTFTGNGTLDTNITTPSSQTNQAINVDYSGITNPSTVNTTSYARITTYLTDDTTVLDTVTVAFAVLDTTSIAVSASVDPNFSFSVAGVASGGNFNGGSGNINVTSTATTIPFSTLGNGSPKIAAHDITISTNAANGYTVTASHSANAQGTGAPLISGGTNNIDPFTGTNTSPTTWSAPGGTAANTNTGFFGYSTEDATLCTGTVDRFTNGGAKWAGSTTVGAEVVCSATGASSQTTRIGWEAEVNAVQPAGAYTGTVILVATPTY